MANLYNRVKRGEKLTGVCTIEKVTIFTFGRLWKKSYECLIHESER